MAFLSRHRTSAAPRGSSLAPRPPGMATLGTVPRSKWSHKGSPWVTLFLFALALLLLRSLKQAPTEEPVTASEASPTAEGTTSVRLPGSPAESETSSRTQGALPPVASSQLASPALGRRGLAGIEVPSIQGHIVDPQGRPIAKATARLGPHRAESDATGRFTLPQAAGPLRLTHPDFFARTLHPAGSSSSNARHERARGFERLQSSAVERETAGRKPEWESSPWDFARGFLGPVLLLPGARLEGRVTRADGAPVPGARVTFQQANDRTEVATSADGEYTSPLLRVAPVTLFFSHPAQVPSRRTRRDLLPGMRHREDVKLDSGTGLSLTVVAPGGAPVADAGVWLRPPTPSPLAGSELAQNERQKDVFLGWTGDLGHLTTRRPSWPDASLHLEAVSFNPQTVPLTGASCRVELVRGHALAVQAVDATTGLPARVREVRVERLQDGVFQGVPTGHADGVSFRATGKFLVNLPGKACTLRVHAFADGNRRGTSDPLQFDGHAVPEDPLVVPIEEHAELVGRVVGPEDEHFPIAVELVPQGPLRRHDGSVTGRENVLPGDGAFAGAALAFSSMAVDASAGSRAMEPGLQGSPAPRIVRTTKQGQFRFEGFAPGTYRLRARLPGFAPYLSAPLALPVAGRLGEVPVRLQRGRKLIGQAVRASGEPVGRLQLALRRGSHLEQTAWSDKEGRFEFRDLAPGAGYTLTLPRAASDGNPGETAHPSGQAPPREVTIPEDQDVYYRLQL